MTTLALVVPSLGRPGGLRRLLAGVAAMADGPDETVVVAGDAATAEAAAAEGVAAVRVRGLNAPAARNAGWRRTSCDAVAFLDDDCAPGPLWARAARAAIRRDARTGAVAGPVSNPDPGRAVTRAAQAWVERRFAPGPAAWLWTQNLVVRREVLDAVGGFDERLDAFEDVDVSLRIVDAGWDLFVDDAMSVDHHHRDTVGAFLRQQFGHGAGFVRLARKRPSWDQSRRAPLTPAGVARSLALCAARPVRCAAGMPGAADRLRTLPLFAMREAAFLAGALAEALRTGDVAA